MIFFLARLTRLMGSRLLGWRLPAAAAAAPAPGTAPTIRIGAF